MVAATVLLAFLVGVPRPAGAQGLQPPARSASALERGVGLLLAGDYRAAALALLEAKRLEGANPNAHLAHGLAAMCLGDAATAKASYLDALRVRATYAPAHNAMGILLLKTDDVAQACTYFRNALRFEPGYEEARANLAHCLCLQGVAGQALKECQLALSRLGDYPFLLEVAASASILDGDFDRGKAYLNRLTELRGAAPAAALDLKAPVPEGGDARPASAPTGVIDPRRPTLPSGAAHRLDVPLRTGRLVTTSPLPPPTSVSEVTVVTVPTLPQGTRYLAFLVDGAMKAVTNSTPCRWNWETRKVPNGKHVLAVQAYGNAGLILGQEYRHVKVDNPPEPPKPKPSARRATPAIRSVTDPARVEEHLRRLLRVRANPLRPRNLLAETYERRGFAELAHDEYARLYLEDRSRAGACASLWRLRKQLAGRPPAPVREVWRVEGAGNRVALTFDDGPRPYFTDRILETLREHGIKSTFFLVGKMAAAYPTLVEALLEEGHELANHSYTHPNLAVLTPQDVEAELLRTELTIRQIAETRTRLFRPPGGNYGQSVREAAEALGYVGVFWGPNITSWKGRAPEEIAMNLAKQTAAGDFLLLHNGKDETIYVLPKLIELLTRRGFQFATVSELLRAGRPVSTGRAEASNEY